MPRNKRPGQGHRYSSGGGGIDLGGLLAGIFGGIEANPDFGKVEDSGEFGPQPLKKGADNFYKPRSIFDRAGAAEANAAFKASNYEADQDAQRSLAKERAMTPILQERDWNTNANKLRFNAADIPNQVNLQQQLGNLQLSQEQKSKVFDALQKLGFVNPTDDDASRYATENNETLFNKAKEVNLGSLLKAQGETSAAGLANEVFDTTRQDRLNQAKSTAFGDAALATGRLQNIPHQIKNEEINLTESPLWKAMQARGEGIRVLGEGQKLVTPTGGTIAQSPSRTDALRQMLGQGSATNINSPPASVSSGSLEEVSEGDLIKIGDRYFRRKR